MRTRIAATLALAGALSLAPAAAAAPLFPDLDEQVPSNISVTSAGGEYHLVFASGVADVGAGPLIVRGSRAGTADPMNAEQVVNDSNGGSTSYPGVGTLHYVTDPTHQHWHLLGFEHYELRRPSDYALIAPDHKSGFCLTDDYPIVPTPPGPGVFTDPCHLNDPGALSVLEGISVGWADTYAPEKEGQYVDVTGVPAGLYWLVHRVNVDRLLRESDYSNDVSSRLVQLSLPDGPGGAPQVTPLRSCHGRESCPAADVAPDVTTGAAIALSASDETLAGTVIPNGSDTSYRFEWGQTAAYGSSTPLAVLNPTTDPQAASAPIGGLARGATYHYRLVATSVGGTSYGADATFVAGGAPKTAATRRFAVRSARRLRSGVVRLRVWLPGAGIVSARATLHRRRVAGARRRAHRAGVVTLRLRPPRALRRRRPALGIAARFSPASGAASTARFTLRR